MAYYGNVTYTLGGNSAPYSNVVISGGGSGTVLQGTSYNYSTTWTNSASPYVTIGASTNSALKVSGDADIQGNLRVNGVDLGEALAKIQDHLAILVPDPARLEKYQALREAYEHYKILEGLCLDEADTTKR